MGGYRGLFEPLNYIKNNQTRAKHMHEHEPSQSCDELSLLWFKQTELK